jgi:hypothetical protein
MPPVHAEERTRDPKCVKERRPAGGSEITGGDPLSRCGVRPPVRAAGPYGTVPGEGGAAMKSRALVMVR